MIRSKRSAHCIRVAISYIAEETDRETIASRYAKQRKARYRDAQLTPGEAEYAGMRILSVPEYRCKATKQREFFWRGWEYLLFACMNKGRRRVAFMLGIQGQLHYPRIVLCDSNARALIA